MKTLAWIVGIGIILMALSWLTGKPWSQRWGATDEEPTLALPGDDLVPTAQAVSTRAITIHAPAEAVYPWLLQMGQGRGGLYSYDWLENLVGCDIHSLDHIDSALQNPQIGDAMKLGPWPTLPYYQFVLLEKNQAVILRSVDPATGQPAGALWMFVLRPAEDGATRLIIRHRETPQAGMAAAVMNLVINPISFMMERKMMYGIGQRAEALATMEQ